MQVSDGRRDLLPLWCLIVPLVELCPRARDACLKQRPSILPACGRKAFHYDKALYLFCRLRLALWCGNCGSSSRSRYQRSAYFILIRSPVKSWRQPRLRPSFRSMLLPIGNRQELVAAGAPQEEAAALKRRPQQRTPPLLSPYGPLRRLMQRSPTSMTTLP